MSRHQIDNRLSTRCDFLFHSNDGFRSILSHNFLLYMIALLAHLASVIEEFGIWRVLGVISRCVYFLYG